MKQLQARILGTGRYLPDKVLSNLDLEKIVDTSDDWIVSRTGMKERRIAGENEFTSDMGLAAAKEALSKANIAPNQIDLILVATLTPDYVFPSTACLIQSALGATKAAAVDVQAACTGYLYTLAMAKAFIESGMYKIVLIIASEKLSSIINYKDRNTCVLFGDGAAACVVGSEGSGFCIRDIRIGADGEQSSLLILPAGGSRKPASQETIAENLHYLHMGGRETFKHAVRRMEQAAYDSLNAVKLDQSEISWLVPHQANIRIIEAIAKRFEISMEKVYLTIHKYGNTSASSLGIALDELVRDGSVKTGDNLLLVAFGAGLTWGSGILTKIES